MKIILERRYKKKDYIIGRMTVVDNSVNGEGTLFECDTLECPEGTATETVTSGSRKAIATGTYSVELVYKSKYQKRMPEVMGVPGRYGILIHPGNTPKDTTGCILVGRNTMVGWVTQSRVTFNKLLSLIEKATDNNEKVEIQIGTMGVKSEE